MVMFAFEFAILLITALGITGRYVLSLVEKYILKREAIRRSAARVVEREDARQRHAERTAEVERRRAQGDIVEDVLELEEEDEDEEELDVGGWEEKGTWVFYLELVTGEFLDSSYFLAWTLTWVLHRPPQAPHVPFVFLDRPQILWPSASYHSRCLPHPSLIHHPHPRLHPLPPGNRTHELPLSGRNP